MKFMMLVKIKASVPLSKKKSYLCNFVIILGMKSCLCFGLLILMSVVLCAQPTVNPNGYNVFYYPNGVKSSEGTMVNGQPDGWWKSYNEKGILVSEGNRHNGLLDSVWTFYTEKGTPALQISYRDGVKQGHRIQYSTDEYVVEDWDADTLLSPVRTYTADHHLKIETPYLEGKPHGMAMEYDTAGNIIKLMYYHRGILTKRESVNRTDKFGFKQGKWKYFWPNGNLRLEGEYVNDKRHGYFKEYDEEGNFLNVQKYENDYLVADAQETKQLDLKVAYHSNGQPSIMATYYNGKAEGLRREFDTEGNVIKGYVFSNGLMLAEGITDMEGRRQGKWKEFYPTGELKLEGTYKNSNRTGKWKFYLPDKTVEVEGAYNNKGQQDGEWRWYYANGQLMREAQYDAGTLDGEFVEYDEEGIEVTKGNFVEGSEEGHWMYRRNKAIEEGDYYDGMRTGIWKSWYEEGVICSEIEYDQDLMNGKYTIYYENHVIKRMGRCVNGERDGTWYEYEDSGELVLTTQYKDGKELRWNNYKIEY